MKEWTSGWIKECRRINKWINEWVDEWAQGWMDGRMDGWLVGEGVGEWCLGPLASHTLVISGGTTYSSASWGSACQSSIFASFILVPRSWNNRWRHLLFKIRFYFELLEVRAVNQRHKSPLLSLYVSTWPSEQGPAWTGGESLPGSPGPQGNRSHSFIHSLIHVFSPLSVF